MASFTPARHLAAPPQNAFDVLADHRHCAVITPVRKSELERSENRAAANA